MSQGNNKSNVAAVPKRGAGKQQGLGSCPAEETSNKGASVGQGRVPPESQPGAGRNTGTESVVSMLFGYRAPKATAFEDSVYQESHWLSCSTGVGGSSIPPPERASPEALTCSWLCGRWVAFRTRPLSQAFSGKVLPTTPKCFFGAFGSNLPHRQKKHSPVHDQNSYGWHPHFHSTLVHHLPCCSGAAHPSAELGPKAQGCLQVGRLLPLGTMPQGAPVARGPA